jgi:glycine hydroxymethyltransferase
VLEMQGSVLTNRTIFGWLVAQFQTGGVYVGCIERPAINRAGVLFRCRFANVQPHSGFHANMAVSRASLERGETVLSMAPEFVPAWQADEA